MSDITNTSMNSGETLMMGCGCSSCANGSENYTFPPTTTDSEYIYSDEQSATGTSYNYSGTFFTGDNTLESAVDSVFGGSQWATATLTYSFPNSTSDYGGGYYDSDALSSGFAQMSGHQQQAIRYIYDQIEVFSGLQFTELTGSSDANADLMHAHSNSPGTAYAYYPSTNSVGGDSFYGGSLGVNENPMIGNYEFHTIAHEMGHSLGLKHGHESGEAGATPSAYAGQEYSIMTYLAHADSSATGYTIYSGSYPQGFMMLDIAALQQMYGANFTSNATDTIYTFSTSTGAMLVNGVDEASAASVEKNGSKIFRTVWDGNGNDTYNFSNFSTDLSINLNPGEYIDLDVGGNSYRAQLDWNGGGVYANGHIYNALQYDGDARSLIENATGGSGDDVFYGNVANNILTGNAGNDTFHGSTGSDTVNGGDGTDIVNYSYNIADFLVTLVNSVTLTVQHLTQSFTDTLQNIETFIFDSVSYTFSQMSAFTATDGTSGDDTMRGNANGNTINGLAGNDKLYGKAGNDTLNGGDGEDILIGNEGDDTLNGGNNNDVLYGREDNDTLNGDGGNDRIYGDDGNDTIYGGDGSDTIYGGAGDDEMHGGEGDDLIYDLGLGTGNDTYYGDNGNDTIIAHNGLNTLRGGNGDDDLRGGSDADTIYGDADEDLIKGFAGDDLIYGGTGNDAILGGDGDDRIYGQDGDDKIWGNEGTNTLSGGNGNDDLRGGSGIDTISGDGDDDAIFGYDGEDFLYGGTGQDTIWGGNDNDTIRGNDGEDRLFGDDGNDRIYGDAGNDDIRGGAGDDVMYGGEGDDLFYDWATGIGNDTYYGEGGNDTIIAHNGLNTLRGGDGEDDLRGGSDADTIYGDADNDTIIGNNGNDI